MTKNFKIGFCLLAILLITMTGLALAQNVNGDKSEEPNYFPPTLTAEQKEVFRKLWNDHEAKVYPIHSDLADRRMTLEYLSANSNTSPEEIKKIIAEMRVLKDKLRGEKLNFRENLIKGGFPENFAYGPHGLGSGNCQNLNGGHGHFKDSQNMRGMGGFKHGHDSFKGGHGQK